ncbi:MAG: ATP phosphoribosyltransferase regulatory subunit [Christensenellales bacterium]
MSFRNYVPEGVQDYLPQECFNKKRVEGLMRNRFLRCGYHEIETPMFEYYDVFSEGIGSVRQEKMIKFFDKHGRILTLRPDITIPISRVVSTRMREDRLPIRLCYIGQAFGYDTSGYNEQKEFTQAGIELMGESGVAADAEVIYLAIRALIDTGLENFQIVIGQVEFFKGLMEEIGLQKEKAEQLRFYLDRKNMLEAELLLRNEAASRSVQRRISQIATLFGEREVIEAAKSVSSYPRCRAALKNLEEVYDILCKCGFEQYLSIDLGMLKDIDYYSGIIFRGVIDDLGYSLLAGGRYDALCETFGRDLPATGFAIGIKRVLVALENQNKLKKLPESDIVVGFQQDCCPAAFQMAEQLRSSDSVVVECKQADRDQTIKYAKELGAKKAVYINKEKDVEIIITGECV